MSSSKIAAKAPVIFGNIDEIEKFHSETLLPELENCNKRYSLTQSQMDHNVEHFGWRKGCNCANCFKLQYYAKNLAST